MDTPIPDPATPPATPPGPPPTTVMTEQVPPPPPQTRSVATAVLEILGYAGAAAALSATGIAFDATSSTEQIVLGLFVAVVLVVVGALVAAQDDALHRMRSIFWFVAVLSWVSVVAVLVGPDGMDLQDKWQVVAFAAIVAAVALPLWIREHRSLQLIAAFLSLHVALAALVFTVETKTFFGFGQELPNVRWSALVTVGFGLAGLVLGMQEWIRPRRTAMVLGALAFMVGLPILFLDVQDQLMGAALGSSSTPNLPIAAGIASGIIVLLFGSRAGVVAVIGLGIVAILYGVIALVGANVQETGPAIAVLVGGLVLLGAVVVLARMRSGGAASVAPRVPPAA